MTTVQLAALLIVANSSIFLAGRFGPPSLGMARPSWLPPVWVRAALPLAVAGGLWTGHSWVWWAAVAMSATICGLATTNAPGYEASLVERRASTDMPVGTVRVDRVD